MSAWRAGVAAVDPVACVASALRARAHPFAPTLVVAAGKAAAGMLRGAAPFLSGDTRSIVLLPRPAGTVAPARSADTAGLPASTVVLHGGHPYPTAEGFESTRRILAETDGLGAGDTLLFLVSGGASALLEAPAEGLDEDELVRVYELLVASGLAIGDINLVRGCLSATKAGRLASRAHPARVVTLAMSDVEGDDPRAIGSGPTVPPGRGRRESALRALEVLRAHELQLPPRMTAHLERETVPEGDTRSHGGEPDCTVVASIGHAVRAARAELERRGYSLGDAGSYLKGTTTDCASRIAGELESLGDDAPRAAVFGGEPTVAVTSDHPGRGGRNLDLAARIALRIRGRDGLVFAVAGTDGCDGSSRAAGAVVDGGSASRAEAGGCPLVAALAAFDTETALEAAGDLVVTGPTGTNVGDLVVAVGRPGARPGI